MRTGAIQKLNTDSTSALDPQMSHNGDWLAYVTMNQSWSVDQISVNKARGAAAERLIASSGRNHSAKYSPDGKEIAFVSDRSGTWEIWICDTSCAEPRQVTHFRGPWIGGLSWSPDSRQLAFDARVAHKSAIYRLTMAHGEPSPIESNDFEERMPSWSIDGKSLYFNSDRDGSVSIWRRSLESGATEKIDAANAFYAREFGSSENLVMGHSDGTLWLAQAQKRNALSAVGIADPVLAWTTFGGKIYFCQREGNDWLRVIESFHGNERLVTRITAQTPQSSASLDISPDGSHLLLSVVDHSSSNIYIRRGGLQ